MAWPPDTYNDDIEQHVLALKAEDQRKMARLTLAGWRFRHISVTSALDAAWRWQLVPPNLDRVSIHHTLERAISVAWVYVERRAYDG